MILQDDFPEEHLLGLQNVVRSQECRDKFISFYTFRRLITRASLKQ